jgi:hypothetical protein
MGKLVQRSYCSSLRTYEINPDFPSIPLDPISWPFWDHSSRDFVIFGTIIVCNNILLFSL